MFGCLKKGNVLSNAEFWKKLQGLVNVISGSSGLLILIYPPLQGLLTPELIVAVSTTLASLNAYFVVATTDKIGL